MHFTWENKVLIFISGPVRRVRKWGRQINKLQFNGQDINLFMRGRPERNNNANPSKEIQLPCVLSRTNSCRHHVNRLWAMPPQMWGDWRTSEQEGQEVDECSGAVCKKLIAGEMDLD